MLLFHNAPVLNDVDGHVRVDVAQHVQVHADVVVDFDDVLAPHEGGLHILDNGHGALQLVQVQVFVNVHATARVDVVDHDASLDTINIHWAASSSFRISAMRTKRPLRTCLK